MPLNPRPTALDGSVDLLERTREWQHYGAQLAVANGAAEYPRALLEQQIALLGGNIELFGNGRGKQGFSLLAAAGEFPREHGEHAGIQPAGQRVF